MLQPSETFADADTPVLALREPVAAGGAFDRESLVGWWKLPLLFAIAGCAAFSIDVQTAAFFRQGDVPKFLRELLDVSESFGHGLGVLLIVLAVPVLDRLRRGAWPRLMAASLGAGLAANVVKLLVGRTRPRDLSVIPDDVWASFQGWLPVLTGSDSSHSFPSAHTTTAVGLAVALCCFYPRGRAYFLSLAGLVALNRVETGAHFPSDVCFGAVLGWLTARSCFAQNRVTRFFDHCERTWGPTPHAESIESTEKRLVA